MIQRLTPKTLRTAAASLARRDPLLAGVLRELGTPPAWKRPGTFATFVRIILEQQVSLESAKSTFDRIDVACEGELRPTALQSLGESGLRNIGVTRQKTRYLLALCDDIEAGKFSIRSLAHQDDESVKTQITARLGMGAWTADVYLLLALMRSDVLPLGDLALVKGLEELEGTNYDTDKLVARAEAWRPYRSVATRMVWQSYLHRRGRVAI